METVPKKMGPVGGNLGDAFDDGVFNGVRKIIFSKDNFRENVCVLYMKTEYEKDRQFETRQHGMFVLDYPNEYITSFGGRYGNATRYMEHMILSLFFKTSYGGTSQTFGVASLSENEFMLEGKNGEKLLGFHGRSGDAIDAIGVYVGTGSGRPKKFQPVLVDRKSWSYA